MYSCLVFVLVAFCCEIGNCAVVRPNINVAQIAPFTGIYGLIGSDLRVGLYAAFNETNLNGGIRGRFINFETYDDGGDPVANAAFGAAAIAGGNVAAFIGGVGESFALGTWPLAINASIPVVGHYNGASDIRYPHIPNTPFPNYAVHYRPSQVEEYLAIVSEGFLDLQATKFSIIYQDDEFGREGFAAMKVSLAAFGLLPAASGRIDVGAVTQASLQAAIDNVSTLEYNQGVVLVCRYDSAAEIIKIALSLNTKGSYFVMPSEVSSPSFIAYAATINLTTDNRVAFGVVTPYPVPLPGLQLSKLQERYLTIMAALGFTNRLNHVTMEGYVIGRMFVVMMENSFAEQDTALITGANVTDDFVPTLYREQYVVLDDLLLGPFEWNSCSQGAHRVALALVQDPAPYFVIDLSIPYPNVSVAAYNQPICGYQLAQQNPLLVFALIGDGKLWMKDFGLGMQVIINEINAVGGIGASTLKNKVGMLPLDDRSLYNQSQFALQTTLNLQIMGYVNVPDWRLANEILATTNSTIIGIENPSGFDFSDPNNRVFNRRVINFWPSYYDQATSILKFLSGLRKVFRISMVASHSSLYYSAQLNATIAALDGFGLKLISQVDLDGYHSANQSIFADPAFSSSDAVLLFGDYTNVSHFIADCQNWNVNHTLFTGVNYTLRYYMTTSDIRMEKFQKVLVSLAIPQPDEVYITSPLKDFFKSDNILFTEFVGLMSKYYPTNNVRSLDAFAGYIMMSFLTQVLQQLDSIEVTRFAEILYSYSEFQVGNNFHVGPLVDGAKSVSFLKRAALDDDSVFQQGINSSSCNQGLRDVFFYNLAGPNMSINDMNLANSYATCGAIIIIPPSWVEYYDCSAHVFINDTALIVDPLANPTYVRAELACDGYFDCPDYTDEYNPRCPSGSPVWAGNIVWTIFSGIGIIEALVFMAIVLIFFRDPIFVSVSPWFLQMALLGAIFVYVSIILNGAPLTRGACSSAEWTVVIGLSLIFCSVLARVWRVFRLVGGSKDLRTLRKIPEIALWGITLFLLSIPIIILIVWQSAFPISPTTVRICADPDAPIRCYYRSFCSSPNYWIFFGVIAGYHFTVLVICAYIAIKTRKVALDKRWSEGRALAATIYLFLTLGCILVPVTVTMMTSNTAGQPIISTENRFFLYNFGCALLFFVTFATINAQMIKRVYYVGELTEEDIKFRVRKGDSKGKLSAGTVNVNEEWAEDD